MKVSVYIMDKTTFALLAAGFATFGGLVCLAAGGIAEAISNKINEKKSIKNHTKGGEN